MLGRAGRDLPSKPKIVEAISIVCIVHGFFLFPTQVGPSVIAGRILKDGKKSFCAIYRCIMRRSLVKSPPPLRPPKELAQFFADPPIAGNEKREDYDNLFDAIAAAARPADAIAWLFVRDITDLSWEIRRERSLKLQVIRTVHQSVVRQYLTPQRPGEEEAELAASEWASDPKARRRIDKELAEMGYDPAHIFSEALNPDDTDFDAIDERIASYELRRMAALRAIELYNQKLARRLEAASSEIIEGEFTEAAE
jgi:hypothetical protein